MQYYSNGDFDRAVHLRSSESETVSEHVRIIPVWKGKFFFSKKGSDIFPVTSISQDLLDQSPPIFLLGTENGEEISCVDFSSMDLSSIKSQIDYTTLADLRTMTHQINNKYAALLAYAKGIIRWNYTHAYCGSCGSKTTLQERGHHRECINPSCGRIIFPRIDPAILVLVVYNPPDGPPECLLNRKKTEFGYRCSTFAGFVEIGESLEDAVRREMKEEVNIDVKKISYEASQPWPFPSSIIIGFTVEVTSRRFKVDGVEIKDAKWYTAEEISRLVEEDKLMLSKRDSISRFLIQKWVENHTQTNP
jgi:NAD+ diphosphatase